ncbi:MAG TPA: acetolactate synthase small subunit, partial [Gallionella sp.]|nr:acetolactate synthase small subunit [Gallionella sp.]
DVAAVMDLSEGGHLERELMLVKVRIEDAQREEFKRITESFQGRVIDASERTCTIELTDTCARLDDFLQAIGRAPILETVRTGASGIGRGERILKL